MFHGMRLYRGLGSPRDFPHVSNGDNEGLTCWFRDSQWALSDLLVVCSALSSVRDASDEPMYEEINYLVTPKREDLLSSPGRCVCLALLGSLLISYPLAVSQVFSASADPTSTPDSQTQPQTLLPGAG